MSDPFIAEIKIMPTNFAPRGWSFCNGQILPIAQNTALFALIGVTYGGNGSSTFGLPNLQTRAVMNPGNGPGLTTRSWGETGGTATVTLLTSELPQHTHAWRVSSDEGEQSDPNGAYLGASPTIVKVFTANPTGALDSRALTSVGSGQAHDNMMPYLGLSFVIAMQGIFPPRP
jgi:microcystin-dependent protein